MKLEFIPADESKEERYEMEYMDYNTSESVPEEIQNEEGDDSYDSEQRTDTNLELSD